MIFWERMWFIWKMVAINPQNCLALSKHSTETSETSNKYLSDEQAFNKAATASVQHYKSSQCMTVVSVWNRLCLTQGSLCLYLQVDFLPLSEVASAIWFQMWTQQCTWGGLKPREQCFEKARETEGEGDNFETNECVIFIGILLNGFLIFLPILHAAKEQLKGFPFRYN